MIAFKLPYIGKLSHHIKNKLSKLCKKFCKENFNIKLAFNSFKMKSYFSYKDPIPDDFKSFVVYKFTCASCSSSYIGETCRHFKTGIEEHIKKDSKSHIFKHLHSTTACFDSYNSLSFKIIDNTNSKFDLKIKEALHINWIKLKRTTKSFSSHTFTIACDSDFFLSVFPIFPFLFLLLFTLSLTLIIDIFYCFNYIRYCLISL